MGFIWGKKLKDFWRLFGIQTLLGVIW